MDPATVERLASDEGWSLLSALPPYDEQASLRLQTSLREAGYDADLVAAALTQSRLRAKGREKFGEFADGMLFTPDGLEQATRLPLAARHAERFVRAGVGQVHDLGCGLGADAMAMASLDLTVHAVDADPATARIAAVNLRHWEDTTIACALAEDVEVSGPDVGVWLDPARRTGVADISGRSKRIFSLDGISPTWAHVQQRAAEIPATGAKLSPAFPHAAIPSDAEAQWTSWDGEVLECAIWWGPLAEHIGRSAFVAGPGSGHLVTEADAADALDAPTARSIDRIGPWLYEPDKAVIRAGLVGALVAGVDGAELDPGVGYVAGPAASEIPWAKRYRVVDAMPLSTKALARWLRDHGHDRVTIKKRGMTIDAEVLRRQLKMTGRGKGGSEATLVLSRVGGRQVALVVEAA